MVKSQKCERRRRSKTERRTRWRWISVTFSFVWLKTEALSQFLYHSRSHIQGMSHKRDKKIQHNHTNSDVGWKQDAREDEAFAALVLNVDLVLAVRKEAPGPCWCLTCRQEPVCPTRSFGVSEIIYFIKWVLRLLNMSFPPFFFNRFWVCVTKFSVFLTELYTYN